MAANGSGMKILALDAMGVMYAAGDDVGELLCPFIHAHGGEPDDLRIEAVYREASLGHMTSREFWELMRIDPALEDDYLSRHRLTDGLLEFLRSARLRVDSIWCLSNDVSEWSLKLRERFGLTTLFDEFVISADIGMRKPDEAIYRHLLDKAQVEAKDVLFVDDRIKNLESAAGLGIQTALFGTPGKDGNGSHRFVGSFEVLLRQLGE